MMLGGSNSPNASNSGGGANSNNNSAAEQELARLKTQNALLKKAVIQEKKKAEEAGVQSKIYEQELRRTVEEFDALSFNNDRLTKRVQQLQSELDENEEKTKQEKGWFGWSAWSKQVSESEILSRAQKQMEVIREELTVKIDENENLHMQMFELRKQQEQQIEEMQNSIREVEEVLQSRDQTLIEARKELDRKTEENEAKIREITEKLHLCVNERSSTVDALQKQLAKAKERQAELRQQCISIAKEMERKLPFNDTKISALNSLNLSSHNGRLTILRRNWINVTVASCRTFTSKYTVYINQMKERLQFMARRVPAILDLHRCYNAKIIALVAEEVKSLSTIQSTMNKYCKGEFGSNTDKVMLDAVKHWIRVEKKMCCYLILSYKEETTPEELIVNQRNFASELDRFQGYLTLLFNFSPGYSPFNQQFVIQKTYESFKKICNYIRTIMSLLETKLLEESVSLFSPQQVCLVIIKAAKEVSLAITELEKQVVAGVTLGSPQTMTARGVEFLYANHMQTRDVLSKKAQQYNSKMRKMSGGIHVPYGEIVAQTTEVESTKTKLIEASSKISQLQAALSSLENDKDELQSRLAMFEDRESDFSSALSRYHVTENLAKSHEQRAKELKAQNAELTVELNRIRNVEKSLLAEIGRLHEGKQGMVQQMMYLQSRSRRSSLDAGSIKSNSSSTAMEATKEEQALISELAGDNNSSNNNSMENNNNNNETKSNGKDSPVPSWLLDDEPADNASPNNNNNNNSSNNNNNNNMFNYYTASTPPGAKMDTSLSSVMSQDETLQELLLSAQKEIARLTTLELQLSDERQEKEEECEKLRDELHMLQQQQQELMQKTKPSTSVEACVQTLEIESPKAAKAAAIIPKEETTTPAIDISTKYSISVKSIAVPEFETIESVLRSFFEKKLLKSQEQVREADNRCVEAMKRLDKVTHDYNILQSKIRQMEAELIATRENRQQAKDDLQTLTENYEAQIKMLTEQWAELSDALQKVKEEKKTLKSAKVLCGRCRNWNTVNWLLSKGQNGQLCSKGNHPSSYNFG